MRRPAFLMAGLVSLLVAMPAARTFAQSGSTAEQTVNVTLRAPNLRHAAPAVVWLTALPGTPSLPFVPRGGYTLLQKNRAFEPHLQVVPVGAVVQFPNADPFFHNVFSLFDGKRFDLGLYEAGSSRAVTFPREGISYIFCNIHPEMSAVILTLSTPLYAKGRTGETLAVHGVPPGEYQLRAWVEGVQAGTVDDLQRRIRVTPNGSNQIDITINAFGSPAGHKDKFGKEYGSETRPPY